MRTIYIDCSSTSKSRINTGIQRVVRNIARHAPEAAVRHGYAVRLVALQNGDFCEISFPQFQLPAPGALWRERAAQCTRIRVLSWVDRLRQWLTSLSGNQKWNDFVNAPRYRFGLARCALYPFTLLAALLRRICGSCVGAKPTPLWAVTADLSNDILLLADSTWDFNDVWPAARRFKQQGGYIATVIYDLIPCSHPQFCDLSVVHAFTNWITASVLCVDFYICISRNTETALRAFLRDRHGMNETGHFHLGSNLDLTQPADSPGPQVTAIVAAGEPIFLAVGSLEPRKNLSFVLDAFEHIWLRDPCARLVLVGHNTWKVEDLIERIQRHPLLDTSLFWVRNASDTDLEYLYVHATALIFASMVEGFGLPVVEAMQRGLHVLCSDIPVLRELADGKATFFGLEANDELITAVTAEASAMRRAGTPPRTIHAWMNWQESCDQLVATVTRAHCARLGQETSSCATGQECASA